MLIQGCFPVWYAKRELSKQKEALEQDNMEQRKKCDYGIWNKNKIEKNISKY